MPSPIAASSNSNMVRALQSALVANGYSAPISGTYDTATVTALQAFQGDNALPVGTSCDATCWSALYSTRATA